MSQTTHEADFNWLVEHAPEIQRKYAGRWIAVHHGQIIAVADRADELAKIADQKCPNKDYIIEGVDRHTDVIYGVF